ncbi:MAG: ATP-binding protein [Desulfobacterales bacterium]|nr:ATP-binding protein [Desulfobacterales bacterium]
MDFVGRKREIAAVMRSLAQGRNVVVTGRFGVGRSRLVKHISKLHSDTWQFLFADFSRPASQSCNDLIHQLVPHRVGSRRNRYTRMMYAKDILLGEKLTAHLPRVVVLDNIGKISRQKLAFIRDMRFDSELLFIAIAESFLSEADLFRLRSVLYPSDVVSLHNLGKSGNSRLFPVCGTEKKLDWDENFIQMLAASSEGYPLLMKERLFRETGVPLKKNKPKKR